MKTKETSKLNFHKNTNGGRILSEVSELLSDRTKNNFKIITLLLGLGFDIEITQVKDLQMREDSSGFIYAWLKDNNSKFAKPQMAYKIPSKPKEICSHCKKEKDGIETGICEHCFRFGKSTREQALAWWDSLSDISIQMPSKSHLCKKYHGNMRIHRSLTGGEIEEIWNKEVNGECSKCKQTVQNCECHISLEEKHKGLFQMHKILPKLLKEMNPNQKQFKQFDESLFKAYIDKFSDEDKVKALIVIWNKISYSQRKQFLIDFS